MGTESEKIHGQREKGEQYVQVHRELLYNPSFLGGEKGQNKWDCSQF